MVPRPCSNCGCARYVMELCSYHAASIMANYPSMIVGTFLYDLFFYSGSDSILSEPYVCRRDFPPSIVAVLTRCSFPSERASDSKKSEGRVENLAEPESKHVRTDVP